MRERHTMRLRGGAKALAVHMTGWMVVGVLLALCLGGAAPLMWMWGVEASALWGMMWPALAAHLCLSALVWAGLCRAWGMWRGERAARVMKTARGTVVTETLIVLVPFMLLTSGLSQFAMNNMAGILTNLAAYQAGRTMWVYNTASNASSGPVKARLAAAASVAPVASGSGVILTTNNPAPLDSLRAGVYVSFLPIFGLGLPAMLAGGSRAKLPARALSVSANTWDSFNNALDSDSFSVRAARKLTFAYECTTITPISGNNVGARVAYKHYQAFPWFGWIFGRREILGPANRPGYYLTITRTYEVPQQAR